MEEFLEYLGESSFETSDILCFAGAIVSLFISLFCGVRLIYYMDDPLLEFEKFISAGGNKADNEAFKRFVSIRKRFLLITFCVSLLVAIVFYIFLAGDELSHAGMWMEDFF